MNSQQAKFILRGYRPNGADAGDATFCDALEHARNDPALRDWFAGEQAWDAAISSKLGEIQAPAGLREAILAGARVTAAGAARKIWWRQPAWMAVAAGIALVSAVTLARWSRPAAAGSALAEFALADARHGENHHGLGEETGALQAALSRPSSKLGDRLPVDFAALRTHGCRTLAFAGHDVLEVCFKRDGVWFHCYIVQRADFPSLLAAAAPVLSDQGGVSSASWADAAHIYVLVSEAGRSALEKLI